MKGEVSIRFHMLIHVLRCKRGTWSWDFRRMCGWAYGRWNVWVFDDVFVFRVKCNCFHHIKEAIIYAICCFPPYYEYAELERARCATFPTYKLDLANFANHVGCPWFILISYFYTKVPKIRFLYPFSYFASIFSESEFFTNITKYIRAAWTFSFCWHHLQYRRVYTATHSCTSQ